MADIQLFIIFHKNIFDECYKDIPSDILNKYFTFYAVNEKIKKNYTHNKYNIINEWELPIYDKTFQERGYNENSALYHIYSNNLHKPYKYIGFFQYDMKFNGNIIEFLQKNINSVPTYFYLERGSFNFCSYYTWGEIDTMNYIINDYEQFYNKKFTKQYEYPLLNTYVISIEFYEKVMNWIVQLYNKLYPWCIKPPNASHFGHIGGIYERIMAYAVGEENLHSIQLDIKHDNVYKSLSY